MSSTFTTTLLPEARATAVVEFRVLSHPGGSLCLLRLLPLQNVLHLRNFVGRGVRGGTRYQRGLEQALQDDGEGITARITGNIGTTKETANAIGAPRSAGKGLTCSSVS
jgi:hypothetical protein